MQVVVIVRSVLLVSAACILLSVRGMSQEPPGYERQAGADRIVELIANGDKAVELGLIAQGVEEYKRAISLKPGARMEVVHLRLAGCYVALYRGDGPQATWLLSKNRDAALFHLRKYLEVAPADFAIRDEAKRKGVAFYEEILKARVMLDEVIQPILTQPRQLDMFKDACDLLDKPEKDRRLERRADELAQGNAVIKNQVLPQPLRSASATRGTSRKKTERAPRDSDKSAGRAIELLLWLKKEQPDYLPIYLWLAKAYDDLGQSYEAYANYWECRRRYKTYGFTSDELVELGVRVAPARLDFEERHYKILINHALEVLRNGPSGETSLTEIRRLCAEANELANELAAEVGVAHLQILDYLDNWVIPRPQLERDRRYDALLLFASLLYGNGLDFDAIQVLEVAVQVDPDDPDALADQCIEAIQAGLHWTATDGDWSPLSRSYKHVRNGKISTRADAAWQALRTRLHAERLKKVLNADIAGVKTELYIKYSNFDEDRGVLLIRETLMHDSPSKPDPPSGRVGYVPEPGPDFIKNRAAFMARFKVSLIPVWRREMQKRAERMFPSSPDYITPRRRRSPLPGAGDPEPGQGAAIKYPFGFFIPDQVTRPPGDHGLPKPYEMDLPPTPG
jgi:hypothetical protein